VSLGAINTLLMGINPVSVGVLGATSRIQMLAFVPVFGLFYAVVPMVGYNLGAGRLDRCKRIIWASVALSAAGMGLFGALLATFPAHFMRLFSPDSEVILMGVERLEIVCWSFAIAGVDIMLSAGFQGLGRTHYSMFCQLWRTLIVKVPAAWVLAQFWGVTGVWWSDPISTVACLIVSLILMKVLFNQLERRQVFELQVIEGASSPSAAEVEPVSARQE